MAHGEPAKGGGGVFVAMIAWLALTSSRHAKVVLLLVLALSGVFAYGATLLTTNVDVANVLPRGDYNTTAAHKLTDDFKSAFTQQLTLQFSVDDDTNYETWAEDQRRLLPNRRGPPFSTAPQRANITDEVYVRAIEQAVDFIEAYTRERGTPLENTIALSDFIELINWTAAGGVRPPNTPASFSLPATDPQGERQYATDHQAAVTAILPVLDAVSSPGWTQTAVLMMPSQTEDADLAVIGQNAMDARDAYLAWAEANPDVAYQVFTGENKPLITVELPVANAHSSALTKEDFARLLPLISVFIVVVLFVAFRNVASVLVAFSSLALGTLWTYGIEGFLGIPLNPLNLTLMPLIMGIGIDYSIHVTNEFQEHKSRGMSNAAAFREVGRRGGMALLIATATTVVGLVVMIFSPSVLINEFAILASLSIVIMFLLAVTYIPAALTAIPGAARIGATFRPSALVPFAARGVSKVRAVVIPVVLLLSVVGTIAATSIEQEAFGDPGRNYLEDDPVRIEHERGLQGFYEVDEPDVKANVLVFVGDVTTPESHAYMRGIEASLRTKTDTIISDTLRTIPFLMETWLTVKDGGPGALAHLARQNSGQAAASDYPDTREEIRAEFDQLYASPVGSLGSIFTNGPSKGYTLGVMTFSARAATYDEAARVWEDVWDAVEENSALKPAGLKIAFVGNTATNYLFVAKEVPWVAYMGIAANAGLFLFLWGFFREWKPVLVIMLVNVATTAWWLGVLPFLGVGMAITLTLPLIFISAIGTDYAVHLIWGIKQVGNANEVFGSVGKAVLFSFITTTGPFLIFTQIQDLAVRRTMMATTVAFLVIILATLLIVPAFYRVRRHPVAKRYVRSDVDVLRAMPGEPALKKPVVARRPAQRAS